MNHWKLVASVLTDWVENQLFGATASYQKTDAYIAKIKATAEQLNSDSPLGIEIHKKLAPETGDVVVVRFDDKQHPTQGELDRARKELRNRYGVEIVLIALPVGFDIERIPKEDAIHLLELLTR